tara:strand:+ start:234 stop:644 length:411 start_codon:yes stop_codon:yes gene_type:complete
MKKIKNYVIPRPFYGYNIPIAIQSTYLRDYAAKNNYKFSLPVTEISKLDSYSILRGLLEKKEEKLSNLAMVSIFMLPVFDIKKINTLFNKKHLEGMKLHFPLESYLFTVDELINWAENSTPLINISNDFSKVNKFI